MPRSFRIIAALLTPFDGSGDVDLRALRAHLEWLADAGVDGVLVGGTTGEGPLLTDAEILAIVRETRNAVGGRMIVNAHVGRPGTAATVRLARAAALEIDAVTAVCPYYYTLTQDQLVGHFNALLDGVPDIPVFAYNIPRCTINDLSIDSIRALAGSGLRGVKDSSRDLKRHEELTALAEAHGGNFEAYMGSDTLVLESFELGGAGVVSALANVAPTEVTQLRDALLGGDQQAVDRISTELKALRERVARSPIPLLKRELGLDSALGGGYPISVRAPLDFVSEALSPSSETAVAPT